MQAGGDVVLTKFSRQAADPGAVYLYKEGLFVRAYNEGAYGFIHQVLACKPMRRFVKSAGQDRVVCGVPLTVLEALPAFAQATRIDPLTWRWVLATPVDQALYDVWRETLPLAPSSDRVASPKRPENSAQRLVDQPGRVRKIFSLRTRNTSFGRNASRFTPYADGGDVGRFACFARVRKPVVCKPYGGAGCFASA